MAKEKDSFAETIATSHFALQEAEVLAFNGRKDTGGKATSWHLLLNLTGIDKWKSLRSHYFIFLLNIKALF